MKKSSIGGQAVLEGVMMRSETCMGIAVRKENGEMAVLKKKLKPVSEKHPVYRVPIIRGAINFFVMLFDGVKTISDAAKLYDESMAEDMKPNKAVEFIAKKTGKNPMDVTMFFAVILAVGLALALFFVVPNVITGFIEPYIAGDFLKNLVEGLIRLGIFFVYMASITLMPDIKRLFAYHGAEHKVINCYEHDKDMVVKEAQQFTTRHPRCGTSYMLIVMLIAIVIFSFFGWSDNVFIRVGLRIAMLPVIAGVAYEVLKLLARFENGFTKVLRAPGMALQALSTKQPDDSMVEAAFLAFYIAEDTHTDEEVEALRLKYSRNKEQTEESAQ